MIYFFTIAYKLQNKMDQTLALIRSIAITFLFHIFFNSYLISKFSYTSFVNYHKVMPNQLIADWCYAVIGHLESCNENENFCSCHHSGKKSFFSPQIVS